jgi:hypothetical protein
MNADSRKHNGYIYESAAKSKPFASSNRSQTYLQPPINVRIQIKRKHIHTCIHWNTHTCWTSSVFLSTYVPKHIHAYVKNKVSHLLNSVCPDFGLFRKVQFLFAQSVFIQIKIVQFTKSSPNVHACPNSSHAYMCLFMCLHTHAYMKSIYEPTYLCIHEVIYEHTYPCICKLRLTK